jgi:hypothetical protein
VRGISLGHQTKEMKKRGDGNGILARKFGPWTNSIHTSQVNFKSHVNECYNPRLRSGPLALQCRKGINGGRLASA